LHKRKHIDINETKIKEVTSLHSKLSKEIEKLSKEGEKTDPIKLLEKQLDKELSN
jgi:glutamine synthetase type III